MCFEQTLRHTHTQTNLNTDNPHLRTRLLIQLPTMSFKHWYNKKPNKNTKTQKNTQIHTWRPISAFNCQSFPTSTGTKNTITRTKNTQRLTWRPVSASNCQPWAMHTDTTIPKTWGRQWWYFSINWPKILNQIQWSWPGHRNATLQNLVIWLTINNCHAG